MEAIAAILFLAGLAGIGYCIWRLVRRQRGQGNPEGHPRLRIIGVVAIAALVMGTALMPVEESSESEPAAQEQDAERERREAEQARRDAEAREREVREEEKRERAEAERRRRAQQGKTARVTRVIDGDTIELEGVGRVRLIGGDTPERGEDCYQEATEYLERRVGGQTVRYRYQQERTDRYGRALLDIFRDGQLVNLDIAEAGWGEELTIAPNDRYAERIAEAEADARAEPRGRWAGCSTQPKPDRESTPAPSPGNQDDDSGAGGSGGGGGSVPSGTCSELSITDFRVAPGDPRDGDGDGIACES